MKKFTFIEIEKWTIGAHVSLIVSCYFTHISRDEKNLNFFHGFLGSKGILYNCSKLWPIHGQLWPIHRQAPLIFHSKFQACHKTDVWSRLMFAPPCVSCFCLHTIEGINPATVFHTIWQIMFFFNFKNTHHTRRPCIFFIVWISCLKPSTWQKLPRKIHTFHPTPLGFPDLFDASKTTWGLSELEHLRSQASFPKYTWPGCVFF